MTSCPFRVDNCIREQCELWYKPTNGCVLNSQALVLAAIYHCVDEIDKKLQQLMSPQKI